MHLLRKFFLGLVLCTAFAQAQSESCICVRSVLTEDTVLNKNRWYTWTVTLPNEIDLTNRDGLCYKESTCPLASARPCKITWENNKNIIVQISGQAQGADAIHDWNRWTPVDDWYSTWPKTLPASFAPTPNPHSIDCGVPNKVIFEFKFGSGTEVLVHVKYTASCTQCSAITPPIG